MPDENGTEATRSDASSVDDALFGDAPEDKAVADTEAEDANEKASQAPQGSEDSEEQDSSPEDLKVVVSIKGGRATIGVQRPSADPHIETFEEGDLTALAQEVPAVAERARARWEDTPKHQAYERPAPPARRHRRQQGAAHDEAAKDRTEQQEQQTLTLF